MIFATDVFYDNIGNKALAAGIGFTDWNSKKITFKHTVQVNGIEPYEPGSFYKRELPCLKLLLSQVSEPIDVILVDSYVDLDVGHPGMGRFLYDFLGGSVPVVGVAKSPFSNVDSVEIFRGCSQKPLYITAAGMDAKVAAELVQKMHGEHRIPTMLKRVDSLSRSQNP